MPPFVLPGTLRNITAAPEQRIPNKSDIAENTNRCKTLKIKIRAILQMMSFARNGGLIRHPSSNRQSLTHLHAYHCQEQKPAWNNVKGMHYRKYNKKGSKRKCKCKLLYELISEIRYGWSTRELTCIRDEYTC